MRKKTDLTKINVIDLLVNNKDRNKNKKVEKIMESILKESRFKSFKIEEFQGLR